MKDFVEQITERRRTAADFLKAIITYVIGFSLIGTVVMLKINAWLVTIMVVGIIYAMYKIVAEINVEYEYTLTQNEMDVDKIINRRNRKKIVSVNIRRADEFSMCDGIKEKRFVNDRNYRVFSACSDRRNGCYYMTFASDNGRGILFFSPNDDVREYIEKILRGRI